MVELEFAEVRVWKDTVGEDVFAEYYEKGIIEITFEQDLDFAELFKKIDKFKDEHGF